MPPRRDKIAALIEAANTAMLPVARDASADEVISAYMTMALNAIVVAKEHGASVEALRASCLRLLMHCDDPGGMVS